MKNRLSSPSKRQKKQGTRSVCFVVQGQIQTSQGRPEPGLTVKAFDRNAGQDDTRLGETTTDENGSYSISYTAKQLSGKSAADLVLCIYRDTTLLKNSEVIFGAQPVETHDFVIQSTVAPEFQRISDRIRPVLGKGIGLDGLKQTIDFLDQEDP